MVKLWMIDDSLFNAYVRKTRVFHDDVIWKHFLRYWPFVRGNSPVTGELPAQRPVTRSLDVFLNMRLNKRLSKHWWGEAGDLKRHRTHYVVIVMLLIFFADNTCEAHAERGHCKVYSCLDRELSCGNKLHYDSIGRRFCDVTRRHSDQFETDAVSK